MTKTGQRQAPERENKEHSPFYDGVRRVILAGIGAMAIAQDEVEFFIERLVERGEIAENEGKELVQELKERRKTQREKARERFTKRVEESLERMNVPTKNDIKALNDKLSTLTKKVEELLEAQKKE